MLFYIKNGEIQNNSAKYKIENVQEECTRVRECDE